MVKIKDPIGVRLSLNNFYIVRNIAVFEHIYYNMKGGEIWKELSDLNDI